MCEKIRKSVEYADKRVSISEDEFAWTEIMMAYDEGVKNNLTDLFFNMLPEFINIQGKLYHFNMSKGKRISISYQTDRDENGLNEYLGETFRSSEISLKDVCEKMVNWLFKFEYVQYMPFGYKKMYDEMFNVNIEHSRDFKE